MKNWIAGFRKYKIVKSVKTDGGQRARLFPNVGSTGTNTDLKTFDYRTILEERSQ